MNDELLPYGPLPRTVNVRVVIDVAYPAQTEYDSPFRLAMRLQSALAGTVLELAPGSIVDVEVFG